MVCWLQICDMHLLTHSDTGNAKGAFVEFTTREELEAALSMNGEVGMTSDSQGVSLLG